MNTPQNLVVLVASEKMHVRGARWLRTLIVVAFVGLISLFFTKPVVERSAYDKPLPMPDEIESLLVH